MKEVTRMITFLLFVTVFSPFLIIGAIYQLASTAFASGRLVGQDILEYL